MPTTLTTECWVLHLSAGYTLAISIYQVAELVNNTPRLAIPQAPPHCCYLIPWRNMLIPLIDYQTNRTRSTNSTSLTNQTTDNIMIVKFLDAENNTLYLAFAVTSIKKYTVSDDEFSAANNQKGIPFLSSVISAFYCKDREENTNSKREEPTYIIDMQHLYSA